LFCFCLGTRCNRIVIKLGTGLLTDVQNHLSLRQIEGLVAQIAALHEQKKQIIIVSSGAIGAGMAELGLKQRPKRLDELQAAAAIGQSKLMAGVRRTVRKIRHHRRASIADPRRFEGPHAPPQRP
jgi:glutamate 5-kinase